MKITEYNVIRENSIALLNVTVKLAIQEGWQPLGGVSVVVPQYGTTRHYQAMVKYNTNQSDVLRG